MCSVSHEQGVTVLHIDSEYNFLDESQVLRLRAELMTIVEEADPPLILLDLSQTSFIGSRFIELIVRAWKRLCDRRGRFALSGPRGACMQAIRVAHLTTIWDIHPTREAALQSLLSRPE